MMEKFQCYQPATIGELKALIADLPNDMEVSRIAPSGYLVPAEFSITLRGKGARRLVSRGGVQFFGVKA
ncbi:hypothetical protein ACODYM_29395 [Burkholderia gladioli]|uniref:hypothetical protein n=1 Tax=Burkholderia gladioli TaxID=28095 RepID=UPI003B5083AF